MATPGVAGPVGGRGVWSAVCSHLLPDIVGLAAGLGGAESDGTATTSEVSRGEGLPVGCNAASFLRLGASSCADRVR